MKLHTALVRPLGAAALLAVGLDHLQQRTVDHYAAIPTIGTLFLLNFVSATVVAVALVLPLERLAGHLGRRLHAALALSGVAIAAGSVAGLLLSETSGLFGFMEHGYRGAIVVSLVLEGAAIVLLGVAFTVAERRPAGRARGPRGRRRPMRAHRRRRTRAPTG